MPIIIDGVSEPALAGADNEYVDTTAGNGKIYEYVLRAWDGTHESVNSIVASGSARSKMRSWAGGAAVLLSGAGLWTLPGAQVSTTAG